VEHAATKLVVDEMYLAKKQSIQQKLIPLNPKDRDYATLQYVLADALKEYKRRIAGV